MKIKMTDLHSKKGTIIALVICAILFLTGYFLAKPASAEEAPLSGDYAHYDNGVVTQILADNTYSDPTADGGYRGEQTLIVEMKTGQYKGQSLKVQNYTGPIYGVPLKVGDGCTLTVNTYSDGTVTATVYEYNRVTPILVILALFILATVLVGGKNGAKSLVGLIITVASIFLILFPALMKGAPTIFTTFVICVYVCAVSLIILDGIQKKTVCAWLGSVSGMALALIFAIIAQSVLKINGLRAADVEALLQLRQTGTPIGLTGLLSAGVIISALGAVMDVAMSLSSSLQEVHLANEELDAKALFKSGMNIGRDMVGTMTNTLILAFIGSGLVLILYIYSLGLEKYQLLSSAYLSIELVSGISSSIGVILAVPITALIAAKAYGKRNTEA